MFLNLIIALYQPLKWINRKGLSIFLVVLLVFCITFQGLSQNTCFTVIDSTSLEAIPYCNILINENQGLVTNHEGQFCLLSTKFDTTLYLSISNISYHPKSFELHKDDTNRILYLSPKAHEIATVDINWSKYRFDWLGNSLKQPDGYINLWRFCQLGIRIEPNRKQRTIIESVQVSIFNNAPQKVPFRLHVYQITDDGQVGEELLPQNVYGQLLQEYERVELDLLKYQLVLPPEGVFVSIELLSNSKPDELMLHNSKYFEKDNNRIAYTNVRYRHRKLKKLSSWKPNSFYVEEYPFTKVEGMVGKVPLIKVKVRSIRD